MPKLVVTSEEMKGRTFELVDEKVGVGRLPENQIRLEDKAISSHHAELQRKGEDYLVRDLNSTNGTRVNGQRVVEQRLTHGDIISFGHLELQYFSSSKSAPQPLPEMNKKTVDLSSVPTGSITQKPATYKSVSPFQKSDRSTPRLVLQVAFFVLGLIALVLLAIFVTHIFGVQ
ncbi:MAG: FHA domain-containing protein [Verrucomicrobiia bacterium]|jgi:pSer/pThr/pTyr-binding forkhead associated (FHA) protein